MLYMTKPVRFVYLRLKPMAGYKICSLSPQINFLTLLNNSVEEQTESARYVFYDSHVIKLNLHKHFCRICGKFDYVELINLCSR